MEAATPLQVVHAFLAATDKDFEAALKFIADDCDYVNGPAGAYVGPEGVRQALAPFFAPILENQFIIKREVASGPVVFIERLDRHRLASGWIELPVTGVWEVHNGKITTWHDYFDLATIQSQMQAALATA